MLQDVEVGEPLEIDGMPGLVIEQEEMTAVAPPALKALYACVSLLIKKIRNEGVCIDRVSTRFVKAKDTVGEHPFTKPGGSTINDYSLCYIESQ